MELREAVSGLVDMGGAEGGVGGWKVGGEPTWPESVSLKHFFFFALFGLQLTNANLSLRWDCISKMREYD